MNKEDKIKKLDKLKNELLLKAEILSKKKKKLYSNINIELPKSIEEKKLDKEIADIFSEINSIIIQKRELNKIGYMTAKQKAARAKFKAVIAEAQKLRKKNPKLTQAQAVKQAWAIEYSKSGKKKPAKKKVGAIKIVEKGESKKTKPKATYQVKRTAKGTYKGLKKIGAVKKKAASKSSYHKDTKSHNVNIKIVSGVMGSNMYAIRDMIEKDLKQSLNQYEILKIRKKKEKKLEGFDAKLFLKYPKYIASLKKKLREQNQLINNNLK